MILGIRAALELNCAGPSLARMNWQNQRLLHHFFWDSMQAYFTPGTQTSSNSFAFAAELCKDTAAFGGPPMWWCTALAN